MKKIFLIIFCIAALSFSGFRFYQFIQDLNLQASGSTESDLADLPKTPKNLRAIDVDFLASRMKNHQELYRQLRDDSLKVYTKLNPTPSQYDAPAQTAIRLAAYLWVWNDYYKEGLWKTYGDYAAKAVPAHPTEKTPADPLINVFEDVHSLMATNYHPNKARAIQNLKKNLEELDKTVYPAHFKYTGYANMIHSLAHAKMYEQKMEGLDETVAMIPSMTDKTGILFGELMQQHVPEDILYNKGDFILDNIQDEEESLTLLWAAFDKQMEAHLPNSSLRSALTGSYFTIFAWTARGSNWSDTVTTTGWRLMGERLKKAGDILEKAYPESTLKSKVSRNMITVVLGLERGKDLMEVWFTNGTQADPDDYSVYSGKLHFLQPRWYGSVSEMLKFGDTCVKTQNWAAKVPMIFIEAVEDLAWKNPKIYATSKIWDPLQKVFNDYLKHYPESTIYRSQFAKCAALGGHFKIAKEQFDLLGDEWDRGTFSEKEYRSLLYKATH